MCSKYSFSNENHFVIFIIYARIPKSGLIGVYMRMPPAFSSFMLVALKGIMLFFHRKSLPDTRLSGPDYWESVCAGQFTRPHELILLDTRKTRNRTIREKCCYGDSNPSRGRERPAWLAGLHYSSNCSNLWGIFVLKSVDICPSGTKYGLWRGFPPPVPLFFLHQGTGV